MQVDGESPVKAKASKKRVVDDSEDEVEAGPSTSAKKPKSSRNDKEKSKAPSPEVKPEKDLSEPFGSKEKGKAKAKPDAAASFFAPRKPAEKKANGSSKGKEKATSPDDASEENLTDVADKEEEEEEDEEQDEETTAQLAEIFTKSSKSSSSSKRPSWEAGKPVPYGALTATFDEIAQTTKRLEISAYLTSFLIEVVQKTPDDLLRVVYLCINRLCPDYEGLELGIGESLLQKAISESTGRSLKQLKDDYKKVGDLGAIAESSRKNQATLFKPKPLTIEYIFGVLKEIAKASGHQSQAKKVGLIKKLLASCQGSETKFLIRSLEGKLRIGCSERTVLVSLAHAVVKAKAEQDGKKWSSTKMAEELEEGASLVKQVFSEIPSYDLVIPALLKAGVHNLKDACKLTPGIPLKPMLAKPTKAISEVLDRFEGKRFTCEYKYDGERAQVHYLEDGSLKVFSRNSENMSAKYPDLVVQVPKCIGKGTTSFVLDCEAVAWDPDTKKLLPFQELSRRKRKDVKAEEITVKVHLFAFDLLYLNGESLLETNLENRRKLLLGAFNPVEGEFAFATSEDATSVEDIQVFLDQSIKDGCEGLMVKMLEGEGAGYEPSRRSTHWLKLKKDYLGGMGDSFDLVVIGGDYGRGKRTNVYGAFHLACWDSVEEEYQMICKIGTGFSDEALKSHWDSLNPLELQVKKSIVNIGTAKGPDVYFEPKFVWEVLAADLSLSPIYPAAKRVCAEEAISYDRGISLRFPRFIRVRDDKEPEESTDPERIVDAYKSQATAAPAGKKKKGGGDFDDMY